MQILATTKSGSTYLFTRNKKGELHVIRGAMSGKITRICGTIEVGKPITFFYLRDGMYGGHDENESYCRTIEVVKLSISGLTSPQ